jgi:hypothetical protein
LSWTNVANESSYLLQRSPDNSTWTTINSPAVNVTSYSNTGLTPSTLYYYRIKAVGDGISYSDSAYGTDNDTTSAGGVSYDTDAQLYFTNAEAGGYTFAVGEKDLYNSLVVGLKADGLYTDTIALYPMFGSSYGSMKWNAINPLDTDGAFRLTQAVSPTYTANGVKCPAVSDSLHTNIDCSVQLTLASNSMGIYIRDNLDGNYYDMGAFTTPYHSISARNSDTAFSDNPNSVAGRISVANTDSTGLWIQTRTSVTSHKLFRDGVQVGSTDTDDCTGGSLPAAPIGIGCVMTGATTSLEGNKEVCFAFVRSTGLDDTQVGQFDARVQTFLLGLGRNV